jgi:methylphosphotriester-DNA--protein-cysteine methyltransferase
MRRKRVLVSIIIIVVFLVAFLAWAADYKYVASSKGNKYHLPTCRAAAKIKEENLVTFKTAKEALDAGYTPCSICKPPAED